VFPGSGEPKTEFIGVEGPSPALGRRGLHLILATGQLASIRPRAAVHYRGIVVGMVSSTALSRDSTAAQVHVLIDPRYARLVRLGSRFWSASGVDISMSLFKGLEINVDSLRSLVAGGIAFCHAGRGEPGGEGQQHLRPARQARKGMARVDAEDFPSGRGLTRESGSRRFPCRDFCRGTIGARYKAFAPRFAPREESRHHVTEDRIGGREGS
jgi:hypothetical protein